MDSFFEDSGSKIKAWVKFMFVIGLIATLVFAIVFGRTAPDRYGDTEFHFGKFVGIGAGGILGSYTTCLFLYAIGEIVCHLKTIADAQAALAAEKKPVREKTPEPALTHAWTSSSGQSTYAKAANSSLDGSWTCRNCGKKNQKNDAYCQACSEEKYR